MKITFNNFTFDDKVIQTIEDKCFMVKAHDFNRYLHESRFAGTPIVDILKEIKGNKEFKKCDYKERDLFLSLEEQKEIVINFYKSLSPEMGKKAEAILNGRDDRYCVNITMDTSKDCDGNVATYNDSTKLNFNANLNEGIQAIRILAHELSHAMSGFKTKAYEVMNTGNKEQVKEYFHHLGRYNVDSVGEIESYIVEKLFMDYLKKQDIISEKDLTNYENKINNITIYNIKTVLEESYIFDNITPPITPDKFSKFVKKIGGLFKSKTNYNTIMNRFIFMFKRDTHSGYSQYDFRYVVGEVVSSLWYEQFSQANHEQKQEMIKSFEQYLYTTNNATLETACKNLVGLGVGDTFKTYISNLKQESLEI